jgi:hypothetical protein
MKRLMMALAVGAALAGCSTGDGNVFASKDKTVEYYRVFDIKTDPANPAVLKAASEGISRHVADATLATPSMAGDVLEQPGHFKLADPSSTAPGAPAGRSPSCEGASWTAKAAPRVNGGDNMNMVACLFPYKNGYHLDMYAVFTKKEGGWLEWPRRVTGRLMGTPEKWTDQTMVDLVRTIRDTTGAQVALVEAKPELSGAPWLEATSSGAAGAAPSKPAAPAGAAPSGTGSGAPGAAPASGGASATGASNPTAGTTTAPVAAPGTDSAAVAPVVGTVASGGTEGAAGKPAVK